MRKCRKKKEKERGASEGGADGRRESEGLKVEICCSAGLEDGGMGGMDGAGLTLLQPLHDSPLHSAFVDRSENSISSENFQKSLKHA